jgi:hypothetical protein
VTAPPLARLSRLGRPLPLARARVGRLALDLLVVCARAFALGREQGLALGLRAAAAAARGGHAARGYPRCAVGERCGWVAHVFCVGVLFLG